jgi:putative spermidine/putrescine transport system permease protein
MSAARADRRIGRALLTPGLLAIAVLLIGPILYLFALSFVKDGLTFDLYARIFTSPAYRVPLINTFVIAALVTVGCVLCAYPLAWIMATLGPVALRILLFVVLLPFWVSALVRTTAWIMLLQRQGVVNTILTSTGLIDEPIAFIFNLSGVLIGMIHVLMPFVVLPLYAAFRSLDRNLLLAAESLGAGPTRIFWRVVAPLTAPGVLAGAVIVFMHALGYYITPALLGGPRQRMIAMMIQFHLQEQLDWGMAAALAIVLLAITLAIFWWFQRVFGLDRLWGGMQGGAAADSLGHARASTRRRSAAGWLAILAGGAVAVFLIAPIVMVFPMSLSRSPFLVFPPPSYSWRWYENLLNQGKWAEALANSALVAAFAVPLATALGTAAALGLRGIGARWRTVIESLLLLPMIVPTIVLAVALYYLYAVTGLVGTRLGLALGHALLGLPLVFVTVRASLRSFDPNLELAAFGLGASRMMAFRRVLLPHLAPGVAAGAVFAFITSFDEVILAIFLTNIESRTLPKLMYEGVAHEIDPTITAVAVLLILASAALLLLSLALRRRG